MRHEQRKLPRGIAAPPASAGWAVSNSCRPRRGFTQPLLEIKEAVLEMELNSSSFLQYHSIHVGSPRVGSFTEGVT